MTVTEAFAEWYLKNQGKPYKKETPPNFYSMVWFSVFSDGFEYGRRSKNKRKGKK